MNTKKFNIKDYFNFKLYLQGLKRLRLTGVVSTICVCVLAVLSMGSQYISHFANDYDISTSLVNTTDSYYNLMYFAVYLVVPVMSLIIWNYLNHRNGSDFYHAVASKRRAVFFSFYAAVVTWAAIVIASIGLVVTVMYLLGMGLYVINFTNVIIFTFNVLISCMLVAAGFAIGCSLSGTVFSNLVISLCILIIPRFLLTLFCIFVASCNDLVTPSCMALLSRYTCNLPISNILSPVAYITSYVGYFNTPAAQFARIGFPTVYTLALSIIYVALGSMAYYRRPSEAAGKPASNKWIQRIITLLIGYCITLIIVYMTYDSIMNEYTYIDTIDFIITCVMVLFFATVSMFIYNIITTKSAKASLKSLISCPIVIGLDVVTILLLILADFSILCYQPSANDISYVKIQVNSDTYVGDIIISSTSDSNKWSFISDDYIYTYEDYYYVDSYYYSTRDYNATKISNIKITDKGIIDTLCDALSVDANAIYEEHYQGDDSYYFYSNGGEYVTVTFGNGITETTRHFTIYSEEYDAIISALAETDEFQDIYNNLPKLDSNTYISCTGVTEAQAEKIYAVYREEMKNVDAREYLIYKQASYVPSYINICKFYGGTPMTLDLPLTQATPKAFALYLKYYNENNAAAFKALSSAIVDTNDVTADYLEVKVLNFAPDDYTPNSGICYFSYDSNYEYYDSHEASLALINECITKFESTMDYSDLGNFDESKYLLCCAKLTARSINSKFISEFIQQYDNSFDGYYDYSYYSPYYYDSTFYFLLSKEDFLLNGMYDILAGMETWSFYVGD